MKPILFATLILAYCAVALPAATLERLTLDQMIMKSTAIVRGKVLSSYATSDGPMINTHYKIAVSETFKGASRTTLDIQLPGGVVNRQRQSFSGVPEFSAGDEYVFFLWAGRNGVIQVTGLTQGLFSIAPTGALDPITTRVASHEVMLEAGTGKPVRDQTLTMRLSQLRSRINYLLGGAQAAIQ